MPGAPEPRAAASVNNGPPTNWSATNLLETVEPDPPGSTESQSGVGPPAHALSGRGGSSTDRGPWQWRVWDALRKSPGMALRIGILAAIVLGIVGAAVEMSGPTTYTSTAVMLINTPLKLATAGNDGELINLEALRYKYSALIDTSAIAGPVSRELGLPIGGVLTSVTGLVPLSSLLMDVQATWSTPAMAVRMAAATAKEVTAYVAYEDVTYDIPRLDRFSFTTIDPASAAIPSKPSAAHVVVLAVGLAIVGLLLGFGGTQLWRNRTLLR